MNGIFLLGERKNKKNHFTLIINIYYLYISERKRLRVAGIENPQRRKKNQLKKKNKIWLRAREKLQMKSKLK